MTYNTIILLVTILYYTGVSIYFGVLLNRWSALSGDSASGQSIIGLLLTSGGFALLNTLSDILNHTP